MFKLPRSFSKNKWEARRRRGCWDTQRRLPSPDPLASQVGVPGWISPDFTDDQAQESKHCPYSISVQRTFYLSESGSLPKAPRVFRVNSPEAGHGAGLQSLLYTRSGTLLQCTRCSTVQCLQRVSSTCVPFILYPFSHLQGWKTVYI